MAENLSISKDGAKIRRTFGFCKFFGKKMQKTLIMQCRDDKMRCSDGLQVATVAEVAQNCGRLVRYRVIK